MGIRLENMEGWGALGILKEAARLLHKHIRLFLPFYLAFQLPASFLSTFLNVFLVPTPHPYTSFVKAGVAYISAQGADVNADSQPSLILTQTLSLLGSIFNTLALAAFAYIVEYIYSNANTASDDDSITKTVFKLLPHALVRIFVTYLWICLAVLLLNFACVIVAFILNAILTAIIGGPSGPTPAFFFILIVPWVIGMVVTAIMFALAQSIAVLEPEKYGRAALKQSTKYASRRASTIFCILFLTISIGLLIIYAPSHAVASAGIPLWVKIILTVPLGILSSVFSAYFGTVEVVMYFVCKSSFEAVILPELQHGSNVPAAENCYAPLLHGSAKPETVISSTHLIGEP